MKNGDEPAFPFQVDEPTFPFQVVDSIAYFGLTKREYFAGLAMQGLSSIDWEIKTEPVNEALSKMAARQAVQMADALLAELAKEAQP